MHDDLVLSAALCSVLDGQPWGVAEGLKLSMRRIRLEICERLLGSASMRRNHDCFVGQSGKGRQTGTPPNSTNCEDCVKYSAHL